MKENICMVTIINQPLPLNVSFKKITGKKTELNQGFVADFREIKPIMRKICKQLDGHTIIPTMSKSLKISYPDEKHLKLEFFNILT